MLTEWVRGARRVLVLVGCPKETNCGNAIAKIGEGKKIVAIVAMSLPKMGGKKKVVAET